MVQERRHAGGAVADIFYSISYIFYSISYVFFWYFIIFLSILQI